MVVSQLGPHCITCSTVAVSRHANNTGTFSSVCYARAPLTKDSEPLSEQALGAADNSAAQLPDISFGSLDLAPRSCGELRGGFREMFAYSGSDFAPYIGRARRDW